MSRQSKQNPGSHRTHKSGGRKATRRRRNIIDILLAPEPRIDNLPIPDRRSYRWREPPSFEEGEPVLQDWPLHEAKARLSELVDATLENGPQQISRRGKRAVVVVPADEWDRLTGTKPLNIKEWLLGEPRFDLELPSRKRFRRRKPPSF